jgi:hypothetical protein
MDSKTSLQLLDKIAEVKSAQGGVEAPPVSPSPGQLAEQSYRDSWKNIMHVGGLGLAGGVGVRGLMGLLDLAKRSLKEKDEDETRTGLTKVTIPRLKAAQEGRLIDPNIFGGKDYSDGLIPQGAEWPHYLPGMVVAALGSSYGGWKLMDKLMDTRRKKEVEDELSGAKQDFQSALLSHRAGPKTAAEKSAAHQLGEELDSLFRRVEALTSVEKTAQEGEGWMGKLWNAPSDFIDWIQDSRTHGKMLGAYGAFAIPSALVGYMAGKGITDKFSQRKILEKAQQKREADRAKARPSSLYVVPSTTDVFEEDEEK